MEFDRAVAQLDALVRTLEEEGDERALLLLELVDAIHRPALERLARGELDDSAARAVLAMYDLAPVDEDVLAEEALDDVRAYVESHGGELRMLGVEDGVVRVRLSGACSGCAGSAVTLRRGVEAALRERMPGFRALVAEDAPADEPAEPSVLQIAPLRRPVFADAGTAPAPGALTVADVDGVAVLLADVEGEVYAFRDACPVDGRSLAGARLSGTILVCPWHNCAFDARSGRRVDEDGEGLAVVPVAFGDGTVRVAVGVS